jgi:heparin/heparan-sulfate lyase
LDVLLPADHNRQLTSVGGPGKEYWVFGTNYANDIEPRQLERSSLEPGKWRIELSPEAASQEDLFLTVMQVTDHSAPGRLPVQLVELPDRVGACVARPDSARWVLFRRDGQRSSDTVTIHVPGPLQAGVLVTDLTPGAWRVRRANSSVAHDIGVSPELGAAWFDAAPGTWHLEVSTP